MDRSTFYINNHINLENIRQWRIITKNMVIIETSVFSRLIQELMQDDEYRQLQDALITRPDMGDFIKGSGGIRKDAGNWKGEVRVVVFE